MALVPGRRLGRLVSVMFWMVRMLVAHFQLLAVPDLT
jgi:hypothetical protein